MEHVETSFQPPQKWFLLFQDDPNVLYPPGLVEDYAVDAFRLDTVVYVDLDFVKEVQQATRLRRSCCWSSNSGCTRNESI